MYVRIIFAIEQFIIKSQLAFKSYKSKIMLRNHNKSLVNCGFRELKSALNTFLTLEKHVLFFL